MPNDIEQLKQDFLLYLNFLVFSSPEILVEKIPQIFQKTALYKIEIQHNDDEKILFIGHKDKIKYECHLTKSDLGKFGLSLEDFRKNIEDIKNKASKKIFSQAIKEVIILHNKKLCEIYVPSAILVFNKLYEKFKHANSKEKTSEIYDLILKECIDTFPEENTNAVGLLYSCLSFISAYQYPDLDSFDILENILFNEELDSTTTGTYLNILNAVRTIQLTQYKKTYNKLIRLIETLNSLQVKDQDAMNNLIIELKSLTEFYFPKLIQGTFYEQAEKYKCEKEITEKLRDSCKELIDDYEKKHSDEFKHPGILNSILTYILWLIGKFISPVLSKEKKMTFFSDKKTKITEINSQLDQFATQPFFSRVFNINAE